MSKNLENGIYFSKISDKNELLYEKAIHRRVRAK
jgi:hypothetical protein